MGFHVDIMPCIMEDRGYERLIWKWVELHYHRQRVVSCHCRYPNEIAYHNNKFMKWLLLVEMDDVAIEISSQSFLFWIIHHQIVD
jgi:hypothetical protein